MGVQHESRTVYTCDGCSHQGDVDVMAKHGWLSVHEPGEETVVLCSWNCVAEHGQKKVKEAKE